jgi:hypothetical protein
MVGKLKPQALKDSGAKLTRKARAEAKANLPNPVANLVLADLALRGGGALLRRAVEKGLLTPKMGKKGAVERIKARSMGETLLSTALARVATRSVPGAIVIGGGMLAKTLYDRRKARAMARAEALRGEPSKD